MVHKVPVGTIRGKPFYHLEDRPHWSDVLRELNEHPKQVARDPKVFLSKRAHEEKLKAWRKNGETGV